MPHVYYIRKNFASMALANRNYTTQITCRFPSISFVFHPKTIIFVFQRQNVVESAKQTPNVPAGIVPVMGTGNITCRTTMRQRKQSDCR